MFFSYTAISICLSVNLYYYDLYILYTVNTQSYAKTTMFNDALWHIILSTPAKESFIDVSDGTYTLIIHTQEK